MNQIDNMLELNQKRKKICTGIKLFHKLKSPGDVFFAIIYIAHFPVSCNAHQGRYVEKLSVL